MIVKAVDMMGTSSLCCPKSFNNLTEMAFFDALHVFGISFSPEFAMLPSAL